MVVLKQRTHRIFPLFSGDLIRDPDLGNLKSIAQKTSPGGISSSGQQQFHHLHVATHDGVKQRGKIVFTHQVCLQTGIEQKPGRLDIIPNHGEMQQTVPIPRAANKGIVDRNVRELREIASSDLSQELFQLRIHRVD